MVFCDISLLVLLHVYNEFIHTLWNPFTKSSCNPIKLPVCWGLGFAGFGVCLGFFFCCGLFVFFFFEIEEDWYLEEWWTLKISVDFLTCFTNILRAAVKPGWGERSICREGKVETCPEASWYWARPLSQALLWLELSPPPLPTWWENASTHLPKNKE